jgi:ribosome maturation factor RimP
MGRYVEIILKSGIKIEGKLIDATDGEIIIEEEKGNKKKKEIIQHSLSYDDIKTTKIQIKW